MSAVRKVNEESLAEAASVIAGGGLVVIPTDTVYGVACDPRNEAAIDRIYQVKSRPRFKALQVFLPGAFSPIAVAREDCTLATVSATPQGRRTQGIRVPNSALTLRILNELGPLAASSANRSGDESAQTVEEAVQAFGDDVQLYLDGGPTQGHVASTVVAADPHERDGIVILREGVIPQPVVRKAVHMNGGGLGA